MKFALIAPRSLITWTKFGDMHFIIPETALYSNFYAVETKYKILDNGVYESAKPLSTIELLLLAERMKVDEIVIPDVMFDYEKTAINAEDFFDTYSDVPFKKMLVPQAPDPASWISAYICMTTAFPQADVIGIPKWLDGEFHCRAAVINYLLRTKRFVYKPHHLLGVDSLSDLLHIDCSYIRSCDTSKPFTYTYHNKLLTLWSSLDLPRVDFGTAKGMFNLHLLEENIAVLRKAARGHIR